jgi:hypothetical protein
MPVPDSLTRRVLFTRRGRAALTSVYFLAGLGTLVVYWIWRSPAYGIVQFAIITAGFFWVRWAIRRPATARSDRRRP